jgi:hypothetical protein
LLDNSGRWKLRLGLKESQTSLGEREFTVVTHADLIGDLEAVEVKLVALCGDRSGPADIVLPDVDAVVPCAVVRPRQCHPGKFVGMQLQLHLVKMDGSQMAESQSFPLELADGQMRFCSIARPVANDPIAQETGRWEFRLSVEGRLLAGIPFSICTFPQMVSSIRIESFDIAGTTASGRTERLVPKQAKSARV